MNRNKQPEERHVEFGGITGVSLLIFVLPATIMAINIACNEVFAQSGTPDVCLRLICFQSIQRSGGFMHYTFTT